MMPFRGFAHGGGAQTFTPMLGLGESVANLHNGGIVRVVDHNEQ